MPLVVFFLEDITINDDYFALDLIQIILRCRKQKSMNENQPFLQPEEQDDSLRHTTPVYYETKSLHTNLASENNCLIAPLNMIGDNEVSSLNRNNERLQWSRISIIMALIIIFGSAASTLLHQHVAVLEPEYFFSLSVFVPLSGLVFYSMLVIGLEWHKIFSEGYNEDRFRNLTIKSKLTTLFFFVKSDYRKKLQTIFWAMLPVALCFSVHNILLAYGSSGNPKSPGKPEIPTALLLVLQKLVVPVSLTLESFYDKRRPNQKEIVGILLIMMGAGVTTLAFYSNDESNLHSVDTNPSPMYNLKLICILLSTIPLAGGFLLVKRATNSLPATSSKSFEIELWAVLCFPEFIFSMMLSFVAQRIKHSISFVSIMKELLAGLGCVVFGIQPQSSSLTSYCVESSRYTWIALIPGFAFNLSIPMLVKILNDSTVIPVLRTIAFPLALMISMSNIDPVISTAFSFNVVIGLLIAVLGLFVCYC